MARIRPPRPTGDALAASLHGDPRRAGHHLASAPLLCRRRQPFVANRCGRRHWAVRLHICGYLAVQPHFRQRADDDHPAWGGRECPDTGMGVLRPVDDPRHWSGDLRLELLAKSCPSRGDNTAAGSAAKVLTQNRYLTAKKRTHNGRPTPQIFTRVAASTAYH